MAQKQIFMVVFGVFVLAAGSPVLAASEGDGYDPLYWNGPSGHGDYNILFTDGVPDRELSLGLFSRDGVIGRLRIPRACRRSARQYLKTGRKIWLHRYRNCQADQ